MLNRRPQDRLRAVFLGLYVLLLLVLAAFWSTGSAALISTDTASTLIAFARLSALLGVFSLLIQFVLISRAPWLEPAFGFDRLTRLHRSNGVLAFSLITAHISLVVGGYALVANQPAAQQLSVFLTDYRFLPLAAAAYVLLLITIFFSIVITVKHLRYELWYGLHLINYAILFLALWHQITHGFTLISYDTFRYFWYGLHIAVFFNLLLYRFIRPLALWYKHRFKVEKIEPAANDVYSVYVSGRNLDSFKYRAGQFAKWRFLAKGFWSEEHPFTISVEPGKGYLRLTSKIVGDYTGKIARLPRHAPVLLSGPLGAFTLAKATSRRLLFIAGGIGITPLRAMLATLPGDTEAVLLYAAKSADDIVFSKELKYIAAKRQLDIHYIYSRPDNPAAITGRIDKSKLERLVPDVTKCEVFICGPPAMTETITSVLTGMGVARSRIYNELFSL